MAIKVLTLDGLKYYTTQFKAWITDRFVAKEAGKGLSTNDYSDAEKAKLAGIAEQAQVNVIETVKVNGAPVAVADKAVDIDLSAYALRSDLASAVEWKGAVATVSALPGDAEKGDMYHVEEKSAEYIFDGSEWIEIGSIVDLSAYSTTEQMNSAIALAVAPKANAEDVYDKTAIDGKVGEINAAIALKANAADVYTKTEVDGKLAVKADATALEDAVREINGEVAKKANAADVYTKGEVDSAIGVVDAKFANYYTSAQVDSAIGVVDAKFANYVLASDLVEISNADIDTALA